MACVRNTVVLIIALCGCIVASIFAVANLIAAILFFTKSKGGTSYLVFQILFYVMAGITFIVSIGVFAGIQISKPHHCRRRVIGAYIAAASGIVFTLLCFLITLLSDFGLAFVGLAFSVLTVVSMIYIHRLLRRYFSEEKERVRIKEKKEKEKKEKKEEKRKKKEENNAIMV